LSLLRNKIVCFSALQIGGLALMFSLGLREWPLVAAAGALPALCSLVKNRSEVWWSILHLAFPVLAYGTLELKISPMYFLGAFLILAGFNFRAASNRVPYFPSGPATWAAVEGALPAGRAIRFVDIGSGLGGLNFHLAKRRPESDFIGVEISPLPWLASRVRAIGRRNCSFERGDYNRLDLGEFDVVFAYLSPAVMLDVWGKARREMRPGSMLLSFEFDAPGAPPAQVVLAGRGGRPLHLWVM
jgi:SAM-dependent methyltransferase